MRFQQLIAFSCMISVSHVAYASTFVDGDPGDRIIESLTGPTNITTGSTATINYSFTDDLTKEGAPFISEDRRLSGVIDFGNGSTSPYSISYSVSALSQNSQTVSLSTAYVIPGTYTVSGNYIEPDGTSFCYSGRPCTAPVLSVGTFTLPVSTTINVGKDPAYIAQHQQAAADAKLSSASLALFGSLTGFGADVNAVAGAIAGLVGSAIDDKYGFTAIGKIISTSISIATGVLGGEVGIAIAATYGMMSAYYDVKAAVETKLANDPPNADFKSAFSYSSSADPVVTGLGSAFDTTINGDVLVLEKVLQSRDGELASMEKAEGALAAKDKASFILQQSAFLNFQKDYASLSGAASTSIASLGNLIDSTGEGSANGLAQLDQTFSTTAGQLAPLDAAVPEPSSWSMIILGIGAVGAMMRRQKVSTRVAFA